MTTRRVAIYVRISRDKTGAGLGVERQEQDCRELAERLGWTVVAVYTDNDLSAYSGKPRPGYLALLDSISAGAVDAVIAWHSDRLHRSPVELETYIGVCTDDERDVPTHCVKAGRVDLATPSGRAMARTMGAWARYEVEHMIERQKSAKAQAAAAGKYRGGPRAYGYDRDGVTVVAEEAAIVREMTDRALAGESLRSLVRELNTRGVPTSTGATWKGPALRDVLIRHRNAGLIEHNGQELGDATWPALVDVDVWRVVRAMLTDPARRTSTSATERFIGAGVYRCGICDDGTTMRSAALRAGYPAATPAYRCRAFGHIVRKAEPIDELISEAVIEALSVPGAALDLAEAGEVDTGLLRSRATALRARLDDLAAMFGAGTIDARQLASGSESNRSQLADVEAQLTAAVATSPLSGVADADDVAAAWAAQTVSRQKAIVNALMTVTIHPAPRGRLPGGARFHPESIEIVGKAPGSRATSSPHLRAV